MRINYKLSSRILNLALLMTLWPHRNGNPSTVKTKFFGVAGGRVQFEDCLFDGVEKSEVTKRLLDKTALDKRNRDKKYH